ncbi:MAG: tetratricopeptide repeat protein [Alphaproteobacteria bacterium]|nr:tetratricopeptide repeat protein [Alphaproteobacteria bacterium]
MRKIVFAISATLLTATYLQASENSKVMALEENVRKLEVQLHKAVEELNAQLAAEADKETEQTVSNTTPDPITFPPVQAQTQPTDTVNKRLDAIEIRLSVLEKAKQDLQGARTAEEAKATKEANEKAPALPDTPGTAQYNLAFGLLSNNELEKAKEAFEQLIKDYPADSYTPKAQFHLGDIFRKLGDFARAETAYQTALAHKLEEPVMVECRLGLAESLVSLNKMKPACEQVTILQKEPLDAKQKERLQEISKKATCQKDPVPK